MSIELKIKSKHLSLEAQVIRFEENKLRKQEKWHREAGNAAERAKLTSTRVNIADHRRGIVRDENRATFLARAFLTGQNYSNLEAKVHNQYHLRYKIMPRVIQMVQKYGNNNQRNMDVATWIKET